MAKISIQDDTLYLAKMEVFTYFIYEHVVIWKHDVLFPTKPLKTK